MALTTNSWPKGRQATQMKTLKQQLLDGGATKEDTVVISKSELDNLKRIIQSTDRQKQAKSMQVEDKQRMLELSQARKERIQAIDQERARKGAQKAPEEIERDLAKQEEIKRSRRMMDEESDEVKFMNKVVLYSKCVTIRDAQIEEKQAISSEKKEEQKRLDMMMEMERLKALKMYEEREQKRIEDRRKGAAVIRAQMEEREQERLRQLELKQQEQEAMLRHIDKMKEEDRREAGRKREASKRLMEDVALANAEQIRLKTRQRDTEMEEERRITEYLREKERREQDMAEEQDRTRAEKEREIARLRSMQERAQDKQAELDALRAKRAQESYERDWRRKERQEAEHAQQINRELSYARSAQKMEKEALLAEQAMIENEEFERIIAVQRLEDERERSRRVVEKDRRSKHALELKDQINHMSEIKRRERREFVEEGNKLKKEREQEAEKLERIRAEKLHHLEEQGVPAKYRNELCRKRNTEPLRPSKTTWNNN
eukprot:NODE_1153_length_1630_cov_41.399867_g1085_i0.p1 GENE.NODE_1153_length_1630_cov_41.399867_g1085_i0~~NODE_1153_length_1630_cov_41.399867_g1085_i0.p1  ORF type:complete len:490 (-),score=190.06 NODE_1153_length_1630_cov_41.399867_g1085_i0:69-1538(-)